MAFVFVVGKSVSVVPKATGTFFCLYCGAEQRYQHRAWESAAQLFFVPVKISRGEFVLCLNCESAFRLECLHEASTATCDELIMEVPMRAARANLRFRPRTAPLVFEDEEPEPQELPASAFRTATTADAPTRARAPRTPRRH